MANVGSLKFEIREGVPWVIGLGELDEAVVGAVTDETMRSMSTPGEIVVDLRAVTFLDSSVLGLFVKLRESAQSLTVRDPSLRIRRLFDLTGLSTLFEVIP